VAEPDAPQEPPEPPSLARFSVSQPVLVNLLAIAMVVTGVMILLGMTREVYPSVPIGGASITTVMPSGPPAGATQLAYAPLDGVVAVVDAERMREPDPEILPLARRQVASAGLVLLNKVDLADGGDTARDWVRSVSGTVPIIVTKHGVVTLPTLFGIGLENDATSDGLDVPCFESTTFTSTTPIPLQRLHALLVALPRGIVRIKGILNLAEKPGHRCLLQVSVGRATITIGHSWGDAMAETRLVFIGLARSVDVTRIADILGARPTHEIESTIG